MKNDEDQDLEQLKSDLEKYFKKIIPQKCTDPKKLDK